MLTLYFRLAFRIVLFIIFSEKNNTRNSLKLFLTNIYPRCIENIAKNSANINWLYISSFSNDCATWSSFKRYRWEAIEESEKLYLLKVSFISNPFSQMVSIRKNSKIGIVKKWSFRTQLQCLQWITRNLLINCDVFSVGKWNSSHKKNICQYPKRLTGIRRFQEMPLWLIARFPTWNHQSMQQIEKNWHNTTNSCKNIHLVERRFQLSLLFLLMHHLDCSLE